MRGGDVCCGKLMDWVEPNLTWVDLGGWNMEDIGEISGRDQFNSIHGTCGLGPGDSVEEPWASSKLLFSAASFHFNVSDDHFWVNVRGGGIPTADHVFDARHIINPQTGARRQLTGLATVTSQESFEIIYRDHVMNCVATSGLHFCECSATYRSYCLQFDILSRCPLDLSSQNGKGLDISSPQSCSRRFGRPATEGGHGQRGSKGAFREGVSLPGRHKSQDDQNKKIIKF